MAGPSRPGLVACRRVHTVGKRATPGRFATRVITRGIDPHLQIHYKASKVKADFKEQRALRVETTINDPGDFGVGRRLSGDNWRALRAIAEQTNTRFLAALGEDAPAPPDQTTLTEGSCRPRPTTASKHRDCVLETRG